MSKKTFGQMLREVREAQKISVRRAAGFFEVTPSYLSKVERGIEKPSRDLAESAAAHLDGCRRYSWDEWIVAAGHIPADVEAALLNDAELCRVVRGARMAKMKAK